MYEIYQKYCLDTDSFTQSNRLAYALDIAPGFWDFIDQQNEQGVIYSSRLVYDEILRGNDELAQWVRERRDSGLFVVPDDDGDVQEAYQAIIQYVFDSFPEHNANEFLRGADPWVIAQALVDESIVVTYERRVGSNSQKPKIPNICEIFGTEYTGPYTLLRRLGCRLRL